jgi:TM2 domain-containing membrane protein YozV
MSPRTSDPAVIEHRLLDLAYTTDSVITAPLLAYYAPCAIADAEHVLDRLVAENRLVLEVEDNGAVHYELPNRQRVVLPREVALVPPPATRALVREPPSPAVAAALSLIVPGAGQLYAGRPVSAIVWFTLVVLGYMLIVPGLVLHMLCIAAAAGAALHPRGARPMIG